MQNSSKAPVPVPVDEATLARASDRLHLTTLPRLRSLIQSKHYETIKKEARIEIAYLEQQIGPVSLPETAASKRFRHGTEELVHILEAADLAVGDYRLVLLDRTTNQLDYTKLTKEWNELTELQARTAIHAFKQYYSRRDRRFGQVFVPMLDPSLAISSPYVGDLRDYFRQPKRVCRSRLSGIGQTTIQSLPGEEIWNGWNDYYRTSVDSRKRKATPPWEPATPATNPATTTSNTGVRPFPCKVSLSERRRRYESTFPEGHTVIDTGVDLQNSGLYAIRRSLRAQQPFERVPTLKELRDLIEGDGNNSCDLPKANQSYPYKHLERALVHYGNAYLQGLKLRLGYVIGEGKPLKMLMQSDLGPLQDDEIVIWIQRPDTSKNSSAPLHWKGLRPVPSAGPDDQAETHSEEDAGGVFETAKHNLLVEAERLFDLRFPNKSWEHVTTSGSELKCGLYALEISLRNQRSEPELHATFEDLKHLADYKRIVDQWVMNTPIDNGNYTADFLAGVLKDWGKRKGYDLELGIHANGTPLPVLWSDPENVSVNDVIWIYNEDYGVPCEGPDDKAETMRHWEGIVPKEASEAKTADAKTANFKTGDPKPSDPNTPAAPSSKTGGPKRKRPTTPETTNHGAFQAFNARSPPFPDGFSTHLAKGIDEKEKTIDAAILSFRYQLDTLPVPLKKNLRQHVSFHLQNQSPNPPSTKKRKTCSCGSSPSSGTDSCPFQLGHLSRGVASWAYGLGRLVNFVRLGVLELNTKGEKSHRIYTAREDDEVLLPLMVVWIARDGVTGEYFGIRPLDVFGNCGRSKLEDTDNKELEDGVINPAYKDIEEERLWELYETGNDGGKPNAGSVIIKQEEVDEPMFDIERYSQHEEEEELDIREQRADGTNLKESNDSPNADGSTPIKQEEVDDSMPDVEQYGGRSENEGAAEQTGKAGEEGSQEQPKTTRPSVRFARVEDLADEGEEPSLNEFERECIEMEDNEGVYIKVEADD